MQNVGLVTDYQVHPECLDKDRSVVRFKQHDGFWFYWRKFCTNALLQPSHCQWITFSPMPNISSSHSLLSTPTLVPSERFLQIDYSQMPDLAHTTLRGGSWDRLMDDEQRRRRDRSSLYSDYGVTEPLNESNYMKWKSQIDIVLGHLEYDIALLEPKPDEPEETSSDFVKEKYHKWIKANRMCIFILRISIPETIRAGIPEADPPRS